jgi:hypothetical protein
LPKEVHGRARAHEGCRDHAVPWDAGTLSQSCPVDFQDEARDAGRRFQELLLPGVAGRRWFTLDLEEHPAGACSRDVDGLDVERSYVSEDRVARVTKPDPPGRQQTLDGFLEPDLERPASPCLL